MIAQSLAEFASAAAARTRRNDEGATAVEYGMLVALIAAACVASVGFLGQGVVANLFQTGVEIFNASP